MSVCACVMFNGTGYHIVFVILISLWFPSFLVTQRNIYIPSPKHFFIEDNLQLLNCVRISTRSRRTVIGKLALKLRAGVEPSPGRDRAAQPMGARLISCEWF